MTARAEVLAVLAVMALAVASAVPSVAAQDCSIGRDGWDDIQRFRGCLEEYNPDRWRDPWLLRTASIRTGNPTIVRLLLQEGWDPNASDDGGRSPLHYGARNTNPVVVSQLLDARAVESASDNDGCTALNGASLWLGEVGAVAVQVAPSGCPYPADRTPVVNSLN